jgi:alpha-galactosidase
MAHLKHGDMVQEEERSTYALWVIMAAPLMLGCDIRNLTDFTLGYLKNADLLRVNQDAWSLQGSLYKYTDNGEQIYIKPLSDGSFAFALWNLATSNTSITVDWDLFPRSFPAMHVRDLWTQRNLGVFNRSWTAANVAGHGVAMIIATPLNSSSGGGSSGAMRAGEVRSSKYGA